MIGLRILKTINRKFIFFLVNYIFAGTRFFGIKRFLLRRIGFQIGHGTRIVGPLFSTATLKVGDNCWIGRCLSVNGNGLLVIEDNCDLAPEITVLTGGHTIGNENRRAGEGETYQIVIGNGTWVGARSIILNNTQIGSGCLIAAGACVNKDIPNNVLVGGVPAKIIKELSVLDEK